MPRPDHSADSARLFHFVDGTDVVGEAERLRSGLVHGATVKPARPIAAPSEVAELLDRCAIGLARWLAVGPGHRRRILQDVARSLVDSNFEIGVSVSDDLDVSCEAAVCMVSSGIAELRRAGERPASSRLPVGIQAVLVGHRFGAALTGKAVWPMLLGGSIVVIRPAPDYGRGACVLASSLSKAGLPDGVFNVIHGDAGTTTGLARHPAVAGVLAVGSSTHLAFVARTVAGTAKPTVLLAVRP